MSKQENSVARQEMENNSPIVTPYHEIATKQFKKAAETLQGANAELDSKKLTEAFDQLMTHIDQQLIQNFSQYESESNPTITFTKVVLDQALLEKWLGRTFSDNSSTAQVGDPNDENQTSSGSRDIALLFTAFGLPPDGHAFTVQDVAIDRIMTHFRKCITAFKEHRKIPELTLVLVGSPYGFGGKVDKEWIAKLNGKGMSAYSEVYSPLIETLLKDHDPKKDKVLLQGVSKGSVVADQIARDLPDDWKAEAKLLYDVPAGHHSLDNLVGRLQALWLPIGFGLETVLSLISDPIMQSIVTLNPSFLKSLTQLKNISEDSKDQKILKFRAAYTEGKALLKGNPLQKEVRTYLRSGILDPLSPKPFMKIRQSINNFISRFKSKDQSAKQAKNQSDIDPLQSYFMGRHFFYCFRAKKWVKTINSFLPPEK